MRLLDDTMACVAYIVDSSLQRSYKFKPPYEEVDAFHITASLWYVCRYSVRTSVALWIARDTHGGPPVENV